MKKRIVILGGGESGVGAALLAQYVGFEVFLSDMKNLKSHHKQKLIAAAIDFEENQHTESKILNASEIIKSPGIDIKKSEILQKARINKISIIGEIEFAGRYTKAKKVCITGTDGKTTTTSLTYHLLKNAGLNAQISGNIGISFAEKVLTELQNPDLSLNLIHVIEVSSFMLDDMKDFKADIGILTNITHDHLDRYGKIENYVASKFQIVRNMDKNCFFIYGIDSELIENNLVELETEAIEMPFSIYPDDFDGACGVENDSILIQYNNQETEIDISKVANIQGIHNLYNMMAASIAALVLGVSKSDIEKGLQSYLPPAHRQEKCGIINGISFVNDSKATTIAAVKVALEAYKEPLIWIAGGSDTKGNNYKELDSLVINHVKALLCLGVDNQKIMTAFNGKIPVIRESKSVDEIVAWCLELGSQGDVALLSPACASYDLFDNFEHRGDCFKNAVKHYSKK